MALTDRAQLIGTRSAWGIGSVSITLPEEIEPVDLITLFYTWGYSWIAGSENNTPYPQAIPPEIYLAGGWANWPSDTPVGGASLVSGETGAAAAWYRRFAAGNPQTVVVSTSPSTTVHQPYIAAVVAVWRDAGALAGHIGYDWSNLGNGHAPIAYPSTQRVHAIATPDHGGYDVLYYVALVGDSEPSVTVASEPEGLSYLGGYGIDTGWKWMGLRLYTGPPGAYSLATQVPAHYGVCGHGWAQPAAVGVDLCDAGRGELARAQCLSGQVGAARLTSLSWGAAAPVQAVSANPTIAADGFGSLWLWHHSGSTAQGRYSRDGGATWSPAILYAGYRYPRPAFQDRRPLIAMCRDGALHLFREGASGAVLLNRVATLAGIEEQLVSLSVDGWQTAHLVYRGGSGALVHRYSQDGVAWSAPVTWIAGGSSPVLAVRPRGGGFLACLVAGELQIWRVEPSYAVPTLQKTSVIAQGAAGQVGAVIDRSGTWWVATTAGAAVETYYSRDEGESWELLA
jgi:hypothetical protein